MKVTVLLAIALTTFAMAASAEPQQDGATAPIISTITSPSVANGALRGAPHPNVNGGEPGSPTFDPLAQALGSSSTALLEVELQRLMRTW